MWLLQVLNDKTYKYEKGLTSIIDINPILLLLEVSQSNKIPAIKLTNIKVQTLNPTPNAFSPL